MQSPRLLFAGLLCLATLGCHPTPQAESAPSTQAQATPEAVAEPARPAPVSRPDTWYEAEIHAFELADAERPPEPGQVLGVGSSSIRLWSTLAEDLAPAPVLNRGFGGSKTGEVLEVFNRIVLPYEPSVILYYCGDNDLGTDNADWQSAANGFIAFDQLARSIWPKVRVFNIPIKPSLARWSNWDAMAKANAAVKAYCDSTPGATYLDTVTPMLTTDGTPDPSLFVEDGLHLNDKGYRVWTAVVRDPVVAAWREIGE